MTLGEAIAHAEWCAKEACGECAEEHEQLADWLRELKRARMKIDLLKILRDGFKADAQKYKAENEKLRETLREFHACSKQIGCERCGYSDRCETLDTINELLEIETDHNLEKTNDYRYSPDEICELIDTTIKRMGHETNSDIRLRYDGMEQVTDVGYAWEGVLFLAEVIKREVRGRERNGSL